MNHMTRTRTDCDRRVLNYKWSKKMKLPVAMPSNKERTLIGRRRVAGIDG